ncbi:MAG: hypothetical protein M5U34_21385 [Chloroflexi bacterium]|nr:hypothetical protein [Chloroflexota bacterium]
MENLESWGGNGRYPHSLALANKTAVTNLPMSKVFVERRNPFHSKSM